MDIAAASIVAPLDGLSSSFSRVDELSFSGFVVDRSDLSRRFVVEMILDGYPLKVTTADAFVYELHRDGIGDGCYGFSLRIDEPGAYDGAIVEVRLANIGAVVGAPIALDRPYGDPPLPHLGQVEWTGGLRFTGWFNDRDRTGPLIALVDGVQIASVSGSAWRHWGTVDNVRPVRGFDFHAPRRFANGLVHQFSLLTERREHLQGSPSAFLAIEGELLDAAAHQGMNEGRLRADLADKLWRVSAPFSQYDAWHREFPAESDSFAAKPLAVAMLGGAVGMEETLDSLKGQTQDDWVAAALRADPGEVSFEPNHLLAFLAAEASSCEAVVLGLAGTRLAANTLKRMARVFNERREVSLVYGDVDLRMVDGSLWPLAFPAFDYERMLEQGYCAHLFAIGRATLMRALAAGASNLYRVFSAALDDDVTARLQVVHLPRAIGVLPPIDLARAGVALVQSTRAHCARRGLSVEAVPVTSEIFPAIHIRRKASASRLTLLVCARNRGLLLERCLTSVLPAADRLGAEILVVDNDSSDPQTLDYLASIDARVARVLRIPGIYNKARLINYGAARAAAETLCLLSCATRAVDDIWLEEMLGRMTDTEVGAVGALLRRPSGVVWSGGKSLGPGFAAVDTFTDRIETDGAYGDLLRVSHECSAVSGACLLTRRRDFMQVGGLDEIRFPAHFHDVDLCLKLRSLGRRIVFTPHAKLEYAESTPRRRADRARDPRCDSELRNLRNLWGEALAKDPYYSPVLSLDLVPYSALAWPPRATHARTNEPPVAMMPPAGF